MNYKEKEIIEIGSPDLCVLKLSEELEPVFWEWKFCKKHLKKFLITWSDFCLVEWGIEDLAAHNAWVEVVW